MSIMRFFAIAAAITAVVSAIGKCPLWVSVILLCVVALLNCWPVR